MKRSALLLLAITLALVRSASAASDSIEVVFNSFVATFAKERVDWRKNIVLTDNPREVAPGYQLGFSKQIGYFTFMTKSWEDFQPNERTEVMHDPHFKAFLISLRNASLYPSVGVAQQMTLAERVDPNINPALPAYPIDGVSTHQVVTAETVGTKQPSALDPILGHTAAVPPTRKKQVIEVVVTPEQMMQKEDLHVELFQ